jgi:hypothetical protein
MANIYNVYVYKNQNMFYVHAIYNPQFERRIPIPHLNKGLARTVHILRTDADHPDKVGILSFSVPKTEVGETVSKFEQSLIESDLEEIVAEEDLKLGIK